jgi:transposase InsO family protein
MQTKSKEGKRFMLTFTDDFSRCSTVKFLTQKNQTKKTIEEFVNVLENQMGAKVKAFRMDRGGNLWNKDMADFCAAKGIVHQRTNSYSPQENGMAERLNKTLVERARAMLENSGREFWAEAVNTANSIRNKIVSRIHGKTPIEVLTGEKPPISHLRVFGLECYVHVPSAERRKLDAASKKGVFLGYGPNTNG